jgi:hypothetical protein
MTLPILAKEIICAGVSTAKCLDVKTFVLLLEHLLDCWQG